jgi:hypothetical protein
MIGLDILTWGTEGESNPYRYPIYHYLWGGSIGHAALKLTLPSDPYNDALILKYCNSTAGKSVIPHYIYKGHWIVYFSWWPGLLQEEHEDRIEANSFLNFEYEKKWRPYFTDTVLPTDGWLRDKLGALYDWWYGPSKEISKPIEMIVHLPEAQEKAELINHKEKTLKHIEKALLPFKDIYSKLQAQFELLEIKSTYLVTFSNDEIRKALFIQECVKEYEEILEQMATLEKEWLPLTEARDNLLDELKSIKREFATVGMSPQQVYIAFGNELSPEKLLAKMREIADGEFGFHKIYYNCSTVVREVIAAGLADSLKTNDCSQHLFDTPLKIHRFACQLQQKLINLRLEKVTMLQTKMYLPQYHGHETPPPEALLSMQKSQLPRPS